jgi:chorismate mutase/prephenate dehydrogenase
VLRAMIDALDHELLQLVARRMALVSEVADTKRVHRLRVRDAERERTVLADRAEHAHALGLPTDEVDALFRVLLRASRDHQAARRAELPLDETPRRVAVVGGLGGIGRIMARAFADLGHEVLVADRHTALSAADAAAAADVTVISVPIEVTGEVIDAVGAHVRADALLADVTSLKGEPMARMMAATAATGASVVGMHPMFGPGVHTLQGQRVVLCRGRGDTWADWLARTLTARGLTVSETTPEHHDRMMAVVQVLTHFQTQVFGTTLARLGVPVEETRAFMSPVYRLELYVAARHFAQSPALYGPIEMRNPRTGEITAAFEAATREVRDILQSGDQARFAALFDEVRAFFGDVTDEAVEASRHLIDRLVERS